MGFFKNAARKAGLKAARRDLENHFGFYKMSSSEEIAAMLATAIVARQMLCTLENVEREFPHEVIEGEKVITGEVGAEVSFYILEINKIQKHLAAHPDPEMQFIGTGVTTWILSLRGVSYPELLPQARGIWAELKRGWPEARDTVGVMKPEWSMGFIEGICEPPKLFLPEGY